VGERGGVRNDVKSVFGHAGSLLGGGRSKKAI
jgi:hypothetical protein